MLNYKNGLPVVTSEDIYNHGVISIIANLEDYALEVIDTTNKNLTSAAKERSRMQVDGLSKHWPSGVRFHARRQVREPHSLFIAFTKYNFMVSNPNKGVHNFTNIKKHKTFPYFFDRQIQSEAKSWEVEMLMACRDVLAYVIFTINELKNISRSVTKLDKKITKMLDGPEYDIASSPYLERVFPDVN